MPPGLVAIPFFGTLFAFANLHRNIQMLDAYGPICMMHIGLSNICLISKKEFLHRPPFSVDMEPSIGELAYGEDLQQRRRLMQTSLISPLVGKTLHKVMKNVMQNSMCPIIDDVSDRWIVRRSCNYITFATIYSSIFGADSVPNPKDKVRKARVRMQIVTIITII